jgi:hypothetical protein
MVDIGGLSWVRRRELPEGQVEMSRALGCDEL